MSAFVARICDDLRQRPVRLVVVVATLLGAVLVAPLPGDHGRAEACDELAIPSLGLSRCVVEGGQPEIDAGNVVRFTALSSDTVDWLAGHRTSHGGTFGSLTSIRIGATVGYRGRTYIVTDYRLVNRYQPQTVADWVYSTQKSLQLQTSASSPYVHVWHAVELTVPAPMVATAPPPVPGAPVDED